MKKVIIFILSFNIFFNNILYLNAQEDTIVVKAKKEKNLKKKKVSKKNESKDKLKSEVNKVETPLAKKKSQEEAKKQPQEKSLEKSQEESLEQPQEQIAPQADVSPPPQAAPLKEGTAVTALPLVGYTTDWGLLYGARLITTNYNKNMLDYNYRFWFQFLNSSLGYSDHAFNFKYNTRQGIEFKTRIGYKRDKYANYFGLGNFQDIARIKQIKSNRPIETIGANINRNFQNQIDNDALDDALIDSQNRFFNYDYTSPYLDFTIGNWIRGSKFKWLTGFSLQNYILRTYNNFFDNGTILKKLPSFIDLEQPTGYEAIIDDKQKTVNYLKLGFAYDTRPLERINNPNSGIFTDFFVESSSKIFGSNYTFSKFTYTFRQFYTFKEDYWKARKMEWTFVYRILLNSASGSNVPFFEAGRIDTIEESSRGLGGVGGLRGYVDNQFIDNFMALINLEMRWTFAKTSLLGGMNWQWFVFYDLGRVSKNIQKFALDYFHKDAGLGLTAIWNENTPLKLFVGYSQFDRYIAFTVDNTY